MENFVEVKEILKQFRFFRDKEHYYSIVCLGLKEKWDNTFLLKFREDNECLEEFLSGRFEKNREYLVPFILFDMYDPNKHQYVEIKIDSIPQNIQLEICNILKKRNINLYEK